MSIRKTIDLRIHILKYQILIYINNQFIPL